VVHVIRGMTQDLRGRDITDAVGERPEMETGLPAAGAQRRVPDATRARSGSSCHSEASIAMAAR